jgi:predicted SAM-dependent methyltransferase
MMESFHKKHPYPLLMAQRIVRRMRCLLNPLSFRVRRGMGFGKVVTSINLCSGDRKIPGYLNVDIVKGAGLVMDLARQDLPFPPQSVQRIVCMSAINYFSRARASELISQCFQILEPGGVARFGVQDLEMLAQRYIQKDTAFFFQKHPNGEERFQGPTLGDKFVAWFYGYAAGGYPCQYFYDYESLAFLFRKAGFTVVERKPYRVSRLDRIELIDNRPEQMFFLEAIK